MLRLISQLLSRHLERRHAEFMQIQRLALAQRVADYDKKVAEQAARDLQRWIEDGYFIADDE